MIPKQTSNQRPTTPPAQTDRMSPKNFAKFDKTYMAFGSSLNGLQGLIALQSPQDAMDTIRMAWKWAREAVSQHVDDMYESPDTNERPL